MHSDPIDLIPPRAAGRPGGVRGAVPRARGSGVRVCLRLTADAAQAEERTQDAFVRAWERLATFRGESAFSSWLYRLTVNEVLLGRRAERRREQRIVTTDDPAAARATRGADSRRVVRSISSVPSRRLPPGARRCLCCTMSRVPA